MTLYEVLHGQKPDVSYLVAIGRKAFVHIPKKKTKQLHPAISKELWGGTVDPINIKSGSQVRTRFECPGMFVLWEIRPAQSNLRVLAL